MNFWDALAAARRLEPALGLGVLAEADLEAMFETAVKLRALSVNPRYNLVIPSLIPNGAHRAGLKMLVWTVDNATDIKRLSRGSMES